MQLIKQNNMAGNFKVLFLILLMLSCESRQKNNDQTAINIIDQNFEILMDSISYFDLSKMPKNAINDNIVVNLNAEVMAMDVQESIEMFKAKFKLKQRKIDPIFFKIKKIPVDRVDNYPINVVSSTPKNHNSVNVNFVNFLIDNSNKFASITVIKDRGIGTKFEIYYFKQINGKWMFDGKELLALG